jgi:hypothetical protein
MQEEQSTEQLLLDVQPLSAEVENLKRQKAPLPITNSLFNCDTDRDQPLLAITH